MSVQRGKERLAAGDQAGARDLFLAAIAVDPDLADPYLGLLEIATRHWDYSTQIALGRRAVALAPGDADALVALSSALWRAQRYAECETVSQRALALRPDHAPAMANIGLACYSTGRADAAQSWFEKALALSPNDLVQRNNLAHSVLKSGDLSRGLKLLNCRWEYIAKNPIWKCGLPLWDGKPAATLLLHHEQGFGDTIEFARFIPAIKTLAHAERLIFACPGTLHRLLSGQCGIDELVDDLEAPGIISAALSAKAHSPLLGAVALLYPEYLENGIAVKTPSREIIMARPYLKAPFEIPDIVHGGGDQFAIGLCWGTAKGPERGQQRVIPLGQLVDLAAIPGVTLWSLQVGPYAGDLNQNASNCVVWPINGIKDFADTAAIMMRLDLVVSADSAVAHLAGAIGRPVLMLNPIAPCWRWARGSQPWYPTMRLVDQTDPDNWREPVVRIAEAVGALIRARKAQ
jgi:hypothetical protein